VVLTTFAAALLVILHLDLLLRAPPFALIAKPYLGSPEVCRYWSASFGWAGGLWLFTSLVTFDPAFGCAKVDNPSRFHVWVPYRTARELALGVTLSGSPSSGLLQFHVVSSGISVARLPLNSQGNWLDPCCAAPVTSLGPVRMLLRLWTCGTALGLYILVKELPARRPHTTGTKRPSKVRHEFSPFRCDAGEETRPQSIKSGLHLLIGY